MDRVTMVVAVKYSTLNIAMLSMPVPRNIQMSFGDILRSFLSKTARMTNMQTAVTEHLTSVICMALSPASVKERVKMPMSPQREAAMMTHRAAEPELRMRPPFNGCSCSCRHRGSRT